MPTTTTPSQADVRALLPWLPGNLTQMFTDLWAEHGDAELALAHLRQTPEHRQAFPGIRRDDGSLRYTEQDYMRTRQGFESTLGEFGLDSGDFDFVGLFEGEVTAQQFGQGVAQMVQQLTPPGARPPMALLEQFVSGFTSTGSATLALEQVRDSTEYQQMFPGIRREDGSLVMDEREYFAHREGMRRLFGQWGLNPAMFEGHHPELIQGEVSIDELDARLRAKVEGVQQNLEQVRERFGSFYGIDAMDDRALIAAAIDPQIGLDLLQGRITAAQVAGEAATHGFDRSRERSEALAQIGGLDQGRARELFSQGARVVPRTQRFAERFHDRTGFGVEEFEDAAVFGDATQQQRLQRLHASEQALFRQGGQVRRDREGLGLAGLRRR